MPEEIAPRAAVFMDSIRWKKENLSSPPLLFWADRIRLILLFLDGGCCFDGIVFDGAVAPLLFDRDFGDVTKECAESRWHAKHNKHVSSGIFITAVGGIVASLLRARDFCLKEYFMVDSQIFSRSSHCI